MMMMGWRYDDDNDHDMMIIWWNDIWYDDGEDMMMIRWYDADVMKWW